MKKNTSYLVLFFLFIGFSSIQGLSTNVHLKVMGLKEASAPYIVEDYVLFSYKSRNKIDYVGARFEHEEYNKLHVYETNQYGVFFLLLPMPEDHDELKYRIVVDGIWMSDPFNHYIKQESSGLYFSSFKIVNPFPERPENPEFLAPHRVRFRLFLDPGRLVVISGEFNHWDPYLHPLKEVRPGEYEITLSLPGGKHYYTFLVDGTPFVDPYNPRVSYDKEGERSYFFME